MFNVLVLVVGCGVIALQMYFGLKKRVVLGAILPAAMLAIFVYAAFHDQSMEPLWKGLFVVACLVLEWYLGYTHTKRQKEKETDPRKRKGS